MRPPVSHGLSARSFSRAYRIPRQGAARGHRRPRGALHSRARRDKAGTTCGRHSGVRRVHGLPVDGGLHVEEGRHLAVDGLRMPDEEIATRHEPVVKFAYELCARLPVEVDHDVPAEDHMKGLSEWEHVRQEVERAKDDALP